MTPKQPLTPREHLALGAELSDIDMRLRAVATVLDRAYGLKDYRLADRTIDRLAKLRWWLENRVSAEMGTAHVIEGVPITQAYHGWRDGPGRFPPERLAALNDARERLAEAAEHVFDTGNPWDRTPAELARDRMA